MKIKASVTALFVAVGVLAAPLGANAATSTNCSNIPAPYAVYQGNNPAQIPAGTTITVYPNATPSGVVVQNFEIYVGGTKRSFTSGNSYKISTAEAGQSIYFVENAYCGGLSKQIKSTSYTIANYNSYTATPSGQVVGVKALAITVNPQTVAQNSGTAALPRYEAFITRGSWTAQPQSFTYQWFADGAAIPGATSGTLALTKANVTKKLSVQMTVTALGYSPYVYTTPAYVNSTLVSAVLNAK